MTASHSREIAKNASIVGGATLLSRILGFLRDLIVAFALGAGLFADAFFVAFRIPNLMRRLFGEGSLTMAFIPVYSRMREDNGTESAHEMARSAQAWLTVVLAVITLLAVLLAEPLVMVIAPGFTDNAELMDFTVRLVRICFPYTLFICSVALCMGILNAEKHFLAPALAPCILNICLIASALAGYYSGMNVALAMSLGVLAGGVGQWLLQQPFLKSIGFSWRGAWSFNNTGVLRMARLMIPTVFGAAVYQVNILLSTLLASFLPVGSISYLYYADRLVQFPLGVFGLAISTAALPSLAKLAAQKKDEEFGDTVSSALNLSLFISLPAMAGLAALAAPIIGLLFGRGAFTPQAVEMTGQALVAYAVGLPFIAVARPLVSAFYALEDTRTPVVVAAICVVVNIGLGAFLMRYYAHVGLAAAVSVSSVVNVLLLHVLLWKKTGRAPLGWSAPLKYLALSLIVGAGAGYSANFGWWWLALIPVWAGLYFGLSLAMGSAEARVFKELLASSASRIKK